MTVKLKKIRPRRRMTKAKKSKLKKLLGAELRAARLELRSHLTAQQVASLLADRPALVTYQQYELGLIEPSGMTLLELADILKINLRQLQRRFQRERIARLRTRISGRAA